MRSSNYDHRPALIGILGLLVYGAIAYYCRDRIGEVCPLNVLGWVFGYVPLGLYPAVILYGIWDTITHGGDTL